MASPVATRIMPKHLKATYLADREYLLEETRATKLYYFPGPVLWTLLWGILTFFSAEAAYNLPGAGTLPQYASLMNWTHNQTTAMWVTVFYLFLFVIGLLWLLVRYLRWISTVYAVTSRRVIVQKGILGRDFDEIPVTQVRGVDVHQSVGQRILGYGSVRVSSEGGTRLGNEDWKGIPKPFRFQKYIEDATQNRDTPYPTPATSGPASGPAMGTQPPTH
ncbi:MAG: PH domain-containing protein [Thermoplasmata archaeon]|nr:PH domain-containing protein [Thermoplasmata archaeon]